MPNARSPNTGIVDGRATESKELNNGRLRERKLCPRGGGKDIDL